ncbi:MAG: 3-hydroxybutyrate dehydrogenase [Burkholderiaceae bacterium]|nr:3-hydroxybutyrate dehydrogenase [Burkholderiaceae bacterium]
MLEGKVAVITGSTDGIGLAVARALAGQKASIMLNGFGDPAAVEALRQELSVQHGVKIAWSQADLSVGTQATELIEAATREFGHVDILVNNAGTQHKSPIDKHPMDKWDLVLALNLTAPFQTIRAVLPQMRERHWGRIVNIASIYGLTGGYDRSSYVASKHGLVGLTKAVALETAGSPITCNAVCPGDVSTRIFYKTAKDMALRDNISREEAVRRVAATNMPSGNAVAPAQVAALVEFLCSPAASEVRGSAMSMDGGWLAR